MLSGFRAGDLRPSVEAYLCEAYPMPRMAYDLRRLRLKGLIERLPSTHQYRLTSEGRHVVPFCAKLYTRAICRDLRHLDPGHPTTPLGRAARAYDAALHAYLVDARLCA